MVVKPHRRLQLWFGTPPTVNATTSDEEICNGESVQLNASAGGGTSYTYLWTSDPPGFNSTLQNPVAVPTVTTTYFVTVNSGGCSESDNVTVSVIPAPEVTAGSSTTEICLGEQVQLTATVTGGASYTFLWASNPPGFNSTLQNPVVTPSETTIYTVTVTSAGCTATDVVTVVVHPLPSTPTITQVESTVVSSAIEGNQWFLEGSIIPGATSQVYTPLETGNYQVQVTDENGCLSSLSEVYFFQMVGINEISRSAHLYPNPTTGIVKSDGAIASQGNFELMVVDILGNIIVNAKNPTEINISDQENGVYFYVVRYESGENISGKIVLIK